MELIKPGVTIPFTRYRYIAVAISSVVNLFVLILLFTRGPLLGVDFAGGTVAQLKFSKPVTIGEIRNALGDLGAGDTVIQDFGQQGSNEFLVRLQKTSAQPDRHRALRGDVLDGRIAGGASGTRGPRSRRLQHRP